ncbi:GNAT family N-acetyltransferase [Vagococcus sp.]|uniref:GNAT family N-acetyltransferase n=1 Tax=Vagococcus sp. TaxID=1933889 RepID=UPI003F9E818B
MIRKMTDLDEFEAMYQLSLYAFDVRHTFEEKENFFDFCRQTLNYGDWIDQELASKIIVIPFEINVYGQRIKMGGIGNVSSYPENRGKGSIRHLFEYVFKELEEKSVLLSYLDPFSQPFYRKFGYERIVSNSTVTIPSERLHFLKTTGHLKVKRTLKIETQRLLSIYEKTLGEQHGSLYRESWWVDYHESKSRNQFVFVFDSKDKVVGYLSYHFKANEFYIEEMGYQTENVLKELLNFVVAHKSSFATFYFNYCEGSSFLEYFEETKGITTSLTSSMMARIISFAPFLERFPIKLPTGVGFYLEVEDENCCWNQGTFFLSTVNDKVNCIKIEEKTEIFPVYRGKINHWTQVLLGYLTLEEALRFNFLTTDEQEITLAFYLPSEKPVLYDRF